MRSPPGLSRPPSLRSGQPMSEALGLLRHLAALGGPVLWVIALAGVLSWAVIIDMLVAAAFPAGAPAVPARLWLLRALAMVSPLLGLLGTVSGIIECFRDLTASNGRHLAAGIAEALVCTAAGLVVAVPAIVAHALFSRRRAGGGDAADQAAAGRGR
jgi:biopolymer transport protein ExbB/TolQ